MTGGHRPTSVGASREKGASQTRARPGSTSLLTADDFHLFNEGTHTRLWERMGAHAATVGGEAGTNFAVFAPEAQEV
ncbi:MAG TPA: 1,4-alpha-glucan branching enzyme, partial [Thermoanaerobaculia bacterium]|nr:1,4-alpha-glucan branching enzyme [Thermoanaerobaculia bacterium]